MIVVVVLSTIVMMMDSFHHDDGRGSIVGLESERCPRSRRHYRRLYAMRRQYRHVVSLGFFDDRCNGGRGGVVVFVVFFKIVVVLLVLVLVLQSRKRHLDRIQHGPLPLSSVVVVVVVAIFLF